MTFPFKKAVEIADHYQFLMGRDFSNNPNGNTAINYIIIAPAPGEDQRQFLNLFQNSYDKANFSINRNVFDASEVSVILIAYDGFANILLHEELDSFLTENSLEKIYI